MVMELWKRWWILPLFLLSSIIQVRSYGQVFRPPAHASAVFLRPKRANMFLLEEILPGNLERECFEEVCNYEEAREYYEDTPKTNNFWTVHVDGDQCKPNPCLHGSSCKDGIGGYTCNCTEMFHGLNCELDISQCPINGSMSCDHICIPKFLSYKCSCTAGYTLHSNKRSCVPSVKHPCGRLQPTKQKGSADHVCPNHQCPWQVVFSDRAGTELCSGVVLGPRSVLTSASCLYEENKLHIMQTGSLNISIPVSSQIHIHNRHKRGSLDDDLALVRLNETLPFGPTVLPLCRPTKDFSENVLMIPERQGLTQGPEILQGKHREPPALSYLHTEDCRNQVNFTLTNKMFCMELFCGTGLSKFSKMFRLSLGTPVATVVGNTAFLTGLLLTPTTSHDCKQTLVFTKLSRYLPWIQQHLDMAEKERDVRMTEHIVEYPNLP
ncbi:hypothetical protein DPEC_G00154740 [Dallia pectoralis]|uniref:Uncharacterized protein n=1 Tax=Dallia pectoralis TaxID=75939 RepID=A0ACC2GKG3_DALPE|nr:hypothetical protein DPEC_G00154740 [Dallia pectoralis]